MSSDDTTPSDKRGQPREPGAPAGAPQGQDARTDAARGLMRTRQAAGSRRGDAASEEASTDAGAGSRGGKAAPRAPAPEPKAGTPRKTDQTGRPEASGARPGRAAGSPAGAGRPPLALPPAEGGGAVPARTAGAGLPATTRPSAAEDAQPPVPSQAAAKAQVPAKVGAAEKTATAAASREARPPRRSVSRTAPMSLAAIHAAMAGHQEGRDPLRLAIAVVTRVASVLWLAGAVVIWMRLLGYGGETIVASWHEPAGPWIPTAATAVVMPVISVGLWLSASWGVVLWSSAVLAAIVCTVVAPAAVPFGTLALVANIAGLALACGLAAAKGWTQREGR